MGFKVPEYKNRPSYWEAYCAAYLGETLPKAESQKDQMAIDRGGMDGTLARAARRERQDAIWRKFAFVPNVCNETLRARITARKLSP